MNPHRYLRAYMAGVLLPSWFLLVVLAAFVTVSALFQPPFAVERIIVFPMAVVPNLWGVWNALYAAMAPGRRLSLGLWGALLPLILIPGGLALERFLDVSLITPALALAVLPVLIAIYYLAWKHIVGFFNRAIGAE